MSRIIKGNATLNQLLFKCLNVFKVVELHLKKKLSFVCLLLWCSVSVD